MARPRYLRRVHTIPMTDGYRPLTKPVRDLGFAPGPDVYVWDPAHNHNRYRPLLLSPPVWSRARR